MFNITIQKTADQKALEDLVSMDSISTQALEQFIRQTQTAYNIFWQDNPAKKVQLLGTKALLVFTASAQAQGFIKLMNPDYEELTIPSKYTVTWNTDGSASITTNK